MSIESCGTENMNVLILGANGMMGSMLNYFGNKYTNFKIISLGRDKFNAFNSIEELDKYINKNTVIINSIGAIPQKKYNDNEYIYLNTTFPLKLAEYSLAKNIPLIHLSTNCVFSGKLPNLTEDDMCDADDTYGISKANGEPQTAVVLRCSIIGFEKNTSSGLLEWFLKSNNDICGYSDSFWNGLTTLELSKAIYNIIAQKLFTPRIEHHYSQNTLSKYEMLNEFLKYTDKQITISQKNNGIKYYTLSSKYDTNHSSLEDQIKELFEIQNDYRAYHSE